MNTSIADKQDPRINQAANDIATSIAATLLTLKAELAEKYGISEAELADAIRRAQMMLLAASVAGSIEGPAVTDEQLGARIFELVRGFQAVIENAMNESATE